MGWLSWLFPSDEDRIAKARKLIEADRPADARLEVLEVDHDDARAVLREAEGLLALANLEAAMSWCRAGDDRRVATHLELAERFHHGGHEEAFRTARREMRGLRASRSEADERAKQEREQKQMAVDPLGITGGANWLQDPVPDNLYDPERDELEARLALIVEGYPEAMRPQVTELGAPFARAVLDLDDGRADRALQALLALPDDAPLVRWERARCCHALGDPRAAAKELRAFAERAGGHFDMGRAHSGELLALVTTEAGDRAGALRVIRAVRAKEPRRGGVLFAQLLHATGELSEAETVLTGLIKEHPRQQGLYALLARVRLSGGQRGPAIRALEASQEAICCTPGKCGSQKPNQDVLRMLATLYLEDGVQREQALALAAQALGMVQHPQWADVYLRALVARAERDPDAETLAERVRSLTPAGDPRADRIAMHLAPA